MVAQYTVDVSGSQTGSWTEHHQPNSSKSYLRALAQAPTVITVTVGRRHPIRYVAARPKLRP